VLAVGVNSSMIMPRVKGSAPIEQPALQIRKPGLPRFLLKAWEVPSFEDASSVLYPEKIRSH
jgi:hypothetical protein